jgi:hypothetical protein
MLDRAKQQMVALLLNVASLKISQAEVISEDGANVSQAITYCNEIITDQVLGVSYEVAKDIADVINSGGTVPAGVIPLDTQIIWYSLSSKDLVQIVNLRPNPFSSALSIKYRVPDSATTDRQVQVEIFDVRGRQVYSTDNLALTPGEHEVFWTGIDNTGQQVASGTYFVNIRSACGISCCKVTMIRSR